jgi:hypothetical protein
MVMKFSLPIIFFILLTFKGFAQQTERENTSIKIPAVETKDKDSSSISIKPEDKKNIPNTSGIINNRPLPIEKPKEEFSMFDNSTLRDPGELFEERWNKKAVEQGIKMESMSDQFLGDFKSNGTLVNIRCRDHEFPDGDLVRVFVNDEIFIPSLLLTSGYKSFDVPLSIGFNKIVFLALNQGESGPNTAEFQVYDDNGVLVSSKKWNLLTGVKAIIVVAKEE